MGMIQRLSILSIVVAAGCGVEYSPQAPSDPTMLPGFDLPPAPAADIGMRLIAPPYHGIEPGSSHEICTWTGVKVDHDIDIRKAIGYQLKVGHHIILFASKLNLPAGTQRECTDQDMASFRQVAATGAEGIPSEAPGDLVYRLDAGMYLVMQEHYLNEGDLTVDSQSALDVIFAEPGKVYTPSHSIAFLDTQLDIAPGVSSIDVHCTMNHDIKGWYAIPHMHEWGANFTASITHAGVKSTMFENLPWKKDYAFSPPAKTWDITAPTRLYKDDAIDVHCEWNNTTPNHLHFGAEMCVFYLQTVDDQRLGNLDCDNGTWGAF